LSGLVCPSRTSKCGGKGYCVKGGWGEEGERAKERALGVRRHHSRRIEVNPQRRRFGRRESDFALQALIECTRVRGKNARGVQRTRQARACASQSRGCTSARTRARTPARHAHALARHGHARTAVRARVRTSRAPAAAAASTRQVVLGHQPFRQQNNTKGSRTPAPRAQMGSPPAADTRPDVIQQTRAVRGAGAALPRCLGPRSADLQRTN
jgi:hypothetical protein